MTLDIDKIFEAPGDKIEQSDLKRLQELGILGENIHLFDTFEQPGKSYWIKKYKCNSQIFFMFNYFFFSTSLIQQNHINLEKYLQSDEPNIILQNCNVENQKDIKGSNKIKQVVIVSNSEFPNISSCEFENEVSKPLKLLIAMYYQEILEFMHTEMKRLKDTMEFVKNINDKIESNLTNNTDIPVEKAEEITEENDDVEI